MPRYISPDPSPFTNADTPITPPIFSQKSLDDGLAQACTNGDIKMVKRLLKNSPWLSDQRQNKAMVPITRALHNGYWHVADFLLQCGADVNARNDHGITSLHQCTELDTHIGAVYWLLQNGARLEEQDNQGRTALLCAVTFGSMKIISLLLYRRANIDARDIFGRTGLHIAVAHGNPSLIKVLVGNGANINVVDMWGSTPLVNAAEYGPAASVSALILSGAKLNEKNAFGMTALHYAAQKGCMESASMLIRHHASKDIADHDGRMPLILAAAHGAGGVIQAFIGNLSEKSAMGEPRQPLPHSSVDLADSAGSADRSDSDVTHLEMPALISEQDFGPGNTAWHTPRKSPIPEKLQEADYQHPYGLIGDNSQRFGEFLQGHRDYQHEDQVPFQHTRFLGVGGFARVDEVRLQSVSGSKAGRLFARKVMHIRPHKELFTREHIEKEVSILRKLQHSHVVCIVTTYTQPNPEVFAMIMHPVANYHLDDFLNSHYTHTDTDLKKVSSWFGCLATGLEYLHSSGIRHKDVKPENLLIHGDNILYADFGLSRDCLDEASTTSGPVQARTLMYCAPEVADEERRGKASDVYSLGCCFLEMTTLLCGKKLDTFRKFRETDGRLAYHANIQKVLWWIQLLAQEIRTELQPRAEVEVALETVGEPPPWYNNR